MKRNLLALLVPALLVAGSVHAAEVYNKEGNKIDLFGQVHGLYYFSKDDGQNGDQSYARLGIDGETQINSQLSGFGKWEYQFGANAAESGGSDSATRLGYAGLKYANLGSLDYGRNTGVVYDITSWTDVLPEFGGDGAPNGTYSADNFMQNRGNGMLTYRNSDFFGLVKGLDFALQYQGANRKDNEDDAQESNGDGVGFSVSYDTGMGVAIGGAISSSGRTANQNQMAFGRGDRANTYTVGVKYDANNVYLAAQYTQTYNATFINEGEDGFANKASNIELVGQYHFDFGLTPSIAYLQSRGSNLKSHETDEYYGSEDLLKYIEVGLNHDFNQNMTAYVDYKINLLKNNKFTQDTGISTDNIVALGIVYQF